MSYTLLTHSELSWYIYDNNRYSFSILLYHLLVLIWHLSLFLALFSFLSPLNTNGDIYTVNSHQQRFLGALTPCCGARALGLCTIAISASGASRVPWRHCPSLLPPRHPNSSNCRPNCTDVSRNYGAHRTLTPAFWDSGVWPPSIRTVAF